MFTLPADCTLQVMDGTSKGKQRRGQTRFVPWQVEKLRRLFLSCAYPDDVMYDSMATTLNLEKHQVVKWFKNHRCRKRKQGILDPISPEVSDSKDYRNNNGKTAGGPSERSELTPGGLTSSRRRRRIRRRIASGKILDETTNQETCIAPDDNENVNLDVNNVQDVHNTNDNRLDENTNLNVTNDKRLNEIIIEATSNAPANNENVNLEAVPDMNDILLNKNTSTIQATSSAPDNNENTNSDLNNDIPDQNDIELDVSTDELLSENLILRPPIEFEDDTIQAASSASDTDSNENAKDQDMNNDVLEEDDNDNLQELLDELNKGTYQEEQVADDTIQAASSASDSNDNAKCQDMNNDVPEENDNDTLQKLLDDLKKGTYQEEHVVTDTNDNGNMNTPPMNVNNSVDYFDEFSGRFDGGAYQEAQNALETIENVNNVNNVHEIPDKNMEAIQTLDEMCADL